MELEIQDYLQNYYRRIKIEVQFKDFRKYNIVLELPEAIANVSFTYDNNFTFDANMGSLIQYINKCILEYFRRSD